MPGPAGGFDFAAAAFTANMLSARDVFAEPHFGHSAFCGEASERTSFSNWFPHPSHTYS